MKKQMTWDDSVSYYGAVLRESIRDFFAPFMQEVAEITCSIYGHNERQMNKVVKRGNTDASGGSDLVTYTPMYCIRCNKKWRNS